MTRLVLAALALVFASPAAAQEGAAFLTLGAGARPAAMGGAYVAVGDDLSASSWNPAGLARADRKELLVSHRESLAGTRYEFMGVNFPAARGSLALVGSYLGYPSLSGRDAAGAPTGRYNAFDLSAGLSYGAALSRWPGLSLGAGTKYIRSSIAEATAHGCAFDFGARFERPAPRGSGAPMAAIAIRNLGPGLRYLDERTPLPLTLAAGLGYRLASGWLLALDYSRRPRAALRNEVSLGAEIAILPGFLIRGGFGSAAARMRGSGMSSVIGGFTAGFGLRLDGWSVDLSIVPMGQLGGAQTLSLGARL